MKPAIAGSSFASPGKITHFRKAGIAAPTAAFENNFSRLTNMLDQNDVERVIFLGDLFHNRYNKEWDRFVSWRQQYQEVKMLLLIGNHDILPADLFMQANVQLHDHLEEGSFLFYHHPVEAFAANQFIFCGHVHPVYCLRSTGRQHMKLPCFVLDQHQMILPSFGVFTGGYEMDAMVRRKIYVVDGERVMEV